MGAKHFLGIQSRNIERQLTESDCAVWAIKAICFQMGVSVPPANLIRKHIEIDKGGTTIRDVRDALQGFGVSAQPVQGPSSAIAQAPLPAIALIRRGDIAFHYIVVLEANHRSVRYLDPSVGGAAQTIGAADFSEAFTGSLILCERHPDYVKIDFQQEIKPNQFVLGALSNEKNAAVAMAIGDIFQLLMLLLGILMLKNFFSSSMFGSPNFWFLAGIAICAIIYMWFGNLQQRVRADVKSRSWLSVIGYATRLIKENDFDPKKGMRDTASRCVRVSAKVADAIANFVSLPGSTCSLVLFTALVTWLDPWAGCYAIALSLVLPVVLIWTSNRVRSSQKLSVQAQERNEIGLVYLMAKSEPDDDFVEDMPWHQVEFSDAIAKQDEHQAMDGLIGVAVGRLSIFAGLLIGGLQHQELGMGHTVAVFFLLSIYSSVVGRWAKQLSALPNIKHVVRSLLDLLSDFTAEPLKFSTVLDCQKPCEKVESGLVQGSKDFKNGGTQ